MGRSDLSSRFRPTKHRTPQNTNPQRLTVTSNIMWILRSVFRVPGEDSCNASRESDPCRAKRTQYELGKSWAQSFHLFPPLNEPPTSKPRLCYQSQCPQIVSPRDKRWCKIRDKFDEILYEWWCGSQTTGSVVVQ